VRHGARRRGFTMLEILVVVGILMVLVGIAAVAYRGLDPSDKATKGTLDNLKGMFAEYEAAAGLRNQPAGIYRGGAPVLPGTPPLPADIWKEPAVIVQDPVGNPQSGNVSPQSAARYHWDAIGNTQRVLQILSRIPANKQTFTKLPARQIHGVSDEDVDKGGPVVLMPSATGGTPSATRDPRAIDPPLVLDAWGNPIIFVGSYGLANVDLVKKPKTDGLADADFDQPNMRVTSVGTIPETQVPTGATAKPPAGARPFFASAGPDGNFRTGDDNIYSFQSQ
jgi:type II secretory pathway pseudopilin PulG